MYRPTEGHADFECRWCGKKYTEDLGIGETPSFETTFNCHGCGKEITVTRREEITYECG